MENTPAQQTQHSIAAKTVQFSHWCDVGQPCSTVCECRNNKKKEKKHQPHCGIRARLNNDHCTNNHFLITGLYLRAAQYGFSC